MEIIVKKRLVDQLYEVLKKGIVDMTLKLGSRIDIKNLSKEFGVSETPVRAALNKLADEKFVRLSPRKGYFVFEPNEKDIEEILDLRIMLEVYAIDKGLMDDTGRQKLQGIYQVLKNLIQESEGKKKAKKSLEIDKILHLEIIRSCKNRRVQEFFYHIYDFVQIYQSLESLPKQDITEHIQIVKSLLEENKKEAKKKLTMHLEHAKNLTINSLKRYEVQQFSL